MKAQGVSIATQPLRVWCGPRVMEWSVEDDHLAAALADRWRSALTGRPADLRVSVGTVLRTPVEAAGALTPVTTTSSNGRMVHLQLGSMVRVDWDVPRAAMVCTLKMPLTPEAAGAVLETVVCWLAAAWLPRYGGMLLHAAAILTEDGDTADLFVGPSAAGKTTLARSVERERVLHDDAVVLTQEESGCRAVPGPGRSSEWPHQAGRSHPVGRVFLLQREGAHGVTRLRGLEALPALFRAGFYGMRGLPEAYTQRLALLGALVEYHPCYQLRYELAVDDPWRFIAACDAAKSTMAVSATLEAIR